MAVNFVKFERGSQEIYNRLKQQHRLDENTLYFLYDKNSPENGGLLYLGYTLIGGTGSISGVSTLAELSDVDTYGLSNSSLLWYNSTTEKWVPATAKTIVENSGAVLTSNVTVYSLPEGKTPQEILATINNANEGDIAIIGGESFVYDGVAWNSLASNSLENRITELENEITAVRGEIDSKIAASNHLIYTVKGDLNEIDTTKAENTIFLVPSVNPSTNDSYDEFMYVNGNFERLGALNDVNLTGYATESYVNQAIENLSTETLVNNVIQAIDGNFVTTTTYNNEVGDISVVREIVDDEDLTLSEGIADLYQRLQWKDIVEVGT